MIIRLEDSCDRCGIEVPNGEGRYPDGIAGDRVCAECDTTVEPAPKKPFVHAVPLSAIDPALESAGGELLIEVFDDNELHIAYRHHSFHRWSKGYWSNSE